MADNSSQQLPSPFDNAQFEEAYGAEVSLFLHCHLRGYDRNGDGKSFDHEYYDQYGAPMKRENSWEEGYHVIEKELVKHNTTVCPKDKDACPLIAGPLIAGIGGGVHLYKTFHGEEKGKPWNWTGWIPLQKRWLSQGTFFSNRHFLALRGNEIQNNLWDYHPHDEELGEDADDLKYSQLEPNDKYRGGYWYKNDARGRYLHIITLKSHEVDEVTKACKRYNYIVHPLAYRAAIETIPDNSVDAMQWCINNMPQEGHFDDEKSWGDKCHGLEIFNDFTYYYSYWTIEPEGPHNGELGHDPNSALKSSHFYYYWYDTYPLEFGVFLLDSALARGVYYHTMAANDAFYDRSIPEIKYSDPKRNIPKLKNKQCAQKTAPDPRLGVKAVDEHGILVLPEQPLNKSDNISKVACKYLTAYSYLNRICRRSCSESVILIKLVTSCEQVINRLSTDGYGNTANDPKLPYKGKTAFGYAILLDPKKNIRKAAFKEENGIQCFGLDDAGKEVMDYLIKGRYYSSTGLWNLFTYDSQSPPYNICNQPDPEQICYKITDDMELEFTFLPTTSKNKNLIWRYTIMVQTLDPSNPNKVIGLQTTHGYFKLDEKENTKLDLKGYGKSRVKWLYFTAIKPDNPQHRAWLHAIRGPAFGLPQYDVTLPPLEHVVKKTLAEKAKSGVYTWTPETSPLKPIPLPPGDLDFLLPKASQNNDICVYSMQAHPLQQALDPSKGEVSEDIKESSADIPARILQSVHGYVNLRPDHPTRLNLSASWDKDAVKGKVNFYFIEGKSGQPTSSYPNGNPEPMDAVPSIALQTPDDMQTQN